MNNDQNKLGECSGSGSNDLKSNIHKVDPEVLSFLKKNERRMPTFPDEEIEQEDDEDPNAENENGLDEDDEEEEEEEDPNEDEEED